ncbi:hypothetical protein LRS74_00515 [Streptomyces sp. LX-29]|nr:hypothetical protein [Streptomyces sp. LX-29]WFB05663.1 hypothetical protein LRS74_00515 [Streptomyces sp. LX-29]
MIRFDPDMNWPSAAVMITAIGCLTFLIWARALPGTGTLALLGIRIV